LAALEGGREDMARVRDGSIEAFASTCSSISSIGDEPIDLMRQERDLTGNSNKRKSRQVVSEAADADAAHTPVQVTERTRRRISEEETTSRSGVTTSTHSGLGRSDSDDGFDGRSRDGLGDSASESDCLDATQSDDDFSDDLGDDLLNFDTVEQDEFGNYAATSLIENDDDNTHERALAFRKPGDVWALCEQGNRGSTRCSSRTIGTCWAFPKSQDCVSIQG
jgi:hypothetical protein|tara:strand:+ start:2948 stop:3613 length:666 start_codon:yes stop_codon:yes gene_type:complete